MQRHSSLKFTASFCSCIEFYASCWYICQRTKSNPASHEICSSWHDGNKKRIDMVTNWRCIQALPLGFLKEKDLCQGCRSYFDEEKFLMGNYGPEFQCPCKAFYDIATNDHEKDLQLRKKKFQLANHPQFLIIITRNGSGKSIAVGLGGPQW